METSAFTFRELLPFLDHLNSALVQRSATHNNCEIGIGPRTVALTPWQAATIESALDSNSESEPGWQRLVVSGAAHRLKFANDINECREDPQQEQLSEPAVEMLLRDVEAGKALLSELQLATNALIGEGDMKTAKLLGEFRHQLRSDLTEIKEIISSGVPPEPEVIDEDEIEAQKQRTAYRLDTDIDTKVDPEKLKKISKEKKRQQREAARKLEGRKKLIRIASLSSVLLVLVVVWLVFIVVPNSKKIVYEELQRSDFAGVAVISSVRSQPPSAYITVDSSAWRRLDDQAKKQNLERIGQRLATADYQGAVIRDLSGTIVGQWFRSGGARLVNTPVPSENGT